MLLLAYYAWNYAGINGASLTREYGVQLEYNAQIKSTETSLSYYDSELL